MLERLLDSNRLPGISIAIPRSPAPIFRSCCRHSPTFRAIKRNTMFQIPICWPSAISITPAVSPTPYLQVTEEHFELAKTAVTQAGDYALQYPVQSGAESASTDSKTNENSLTTSDACEGVRTSTTNQMPPVGLEPTTH